MKIFQLKSLLKKQKKRNQKAFDHSFLNTTGRSTLKHTSVSHTTCPERRWTDFRQTDFKNGMKLTARKGTGDFKLKLS